VRISRRKRTWVPNVRMFGINYTRTGVRQQQ